MANRLFYLGLGAALMYFYDPQAGRKRRTELKDGIDSAARKLEQGRDVVERGVRNGAWRGQALSPAQRALAGGGGAALATLGYFRGGLKGAAMCALGSALVVRSTASESRAEALSHHGIQVDKSIVVDAPLPQVYAYWRDLENLPQWMSHVREVQALGDDRFRWVVDGPAGVAVEWVSELLHVEENREMTWHTVGDSQVTHVGRVRFEEAGDGTRIQVQLRYLPPAGAIGHAVARAFGVDPGTEMNEDLARMKSVIETGDVTGDPAWRPGELPPSEARH